MNYNARLTILIIIVLILLVAFGALFYNWQSRTSQPTVVVKPNQPVVSPSVTTEPPQEVVEPNRAALPGTMEYCKLFQGREYETCILGLAYDNNNLEYCDLVENAAIKETCQNRVKLQIALTQNINQCFNLPQVVQTGCVLQYLEKSADKNQTCNQITDQANKDFCQQLISSGGQEA